MSTLKITQLLLKYRPPARWITKESGLPYLQLDIDVPWQTILEEWQQVKDLAVLHRAYDSYGSASNNGWHSLVLYGSGATETENHIGNLQWTEVADQCSKTKQWIDETFLINENTGRIRFMLLEPGGHIILHKDRDTKYLSEINVAITNPKDCEFRFKNYGKVPFQNGTAFMVDISNEHFLFNYSTEPRLHMILHTEIDDKIISKSYENRFYN
jgi:hypothetical protein